MMQPSTPSLHGQSLGVCSLLGPTSLLKSSLNPAQAPVKNHNVQCGAEETRPSDVPCLVQAAQDDVRGGKIHASRQGGGGHQHPEAKGVSMVCSARVCWLNLRAHTLAEHGARQYILPEQAARGTHRSQLST